MDSIRRVLVDRAARAHETTEIFKDLSATVKRYDYQYTSDDARAVKECASELGRLPMAELATGAVGGFLLGNLVKQRTIATLTGMFLCYQARDRQPAADRCMQRMMSLPTPMGAEMIEIIRKRDANHPLLRQLPDRFDSPSRIATTEGIPQGQLQLSTQASASGLAAAVGDGMWVVSDPFDLCFQQPIHASSPATPGKELANKSKAQERKQQRQELYKSRREARKQHQEGSLSDDT